MPESRNQPTSRTAQVLAATLIIALLAALQFYNPSRNNLWTQWFYEWSHVPLFSLIAACTLVLTRTIRSSTQQLIAAAAIVVFLSLLSEVMQIRSARDASFSDLIADWCGATAVFAAYIAFSSRFSASRVQRLILIGIAALLLIWSLQPLARVSAGYWQRYQHLPSLVRWSPRYTDLFVRAQNAKLELSTDKTRRAASATIVLGSGPWPGIVLHDIWPDWSNFDVLSLQIENPESEPLQLNVRVHDEVHQAGQQVYNDRYNRRILLLPGDHTIRIDLDDIRAAPVDRDMQLSNIHTVVIFTTAKEAGRRFIVRDIRLQ